MSGVPRSLDDGQLRILIGQPCDTLAALMTAQLPDSPALADGLAKLDEARACFIRATRLPERQPA